MGPRCPQQQYTKLSSSTPGEFPYLEHILTRARIIRAILPNTGNFECFYIDFHHVQIWKSACALFCTMYFAKDNKNNLFWKLWGRLNIKMSSYQYRILIIKILRFHDRLIFIMEIPPLYWNGALCVFPEYDTIFLSFWTVVFWVRVDFFAKTYLWFHKMR